MLSDAHAKVTGEHIRTKAVLACSGIRYNGQLIISVCLPSHFLFRHRAANSAGPLRLNGAAMSSNPDTLIDKAGELRQLLTELRPDDMGLMVTA